MEKHIKRNFSIFLVPLVLCLILQACTKIDLKEVRRLIDQEKYFDALKILSPSLQPDAKKHISNLEDCLYEGEKAADRAVQLITGKYRLYFHKEYDFMSNPYPEIRKSLDMQNASVNKMIAFCQDIGIHPLFHEGGAEYFYNNEFFELLRMQFPGSKYRAEYEYVLINKRGSCHTWRKWIDELENYVREFPRGNFHLRAVMDLAELYDDLWNLVHPDHDWHFLLGVDFPKDTRLAEDYKKKALIAYQEVADAPNKSVLRPYQIEEVPKRLVDLKKNIMKPGLKITKGYE